MHRTTKILNFVSAVVALTREPWLCAETADKEGPTAYLDEAVAAILRKARDTFDARELASMKSELLMSASATPSDALQRLLVIAEKEFSPQRVLSY